MEGGGGGGGAEGGGVATKILELLVIWKCEGGIYQLEAESVGQAD